MQPAYPAAQAIIFEYFYWNKVNYYEIFHTAKKEYGTVHYMVEKERICTWAEVAVKVATYVTFMIPFIMWVLQIVLQPRGHFELWSADKHFQIDDVSRLAHRSIGLRHVSSQERALAEKEKGFSLGCSFNLTFLEKGFDQLPEWQKLKKVYDYEQAINGHFVCSYLADAGPMAMGTKCNDLFQRLNQCCFMVVDYSRDCLRPTDIAAWSGLGRYPKWSPSPDQIKLLPFFDASRIQVPDPINSKAEGDKFFDALFDTWRKDLLIALRA